MNKKTYHIITIGCQMNVSDSERIAGYLEGFGFRPTAERAKASLVIVTTCGVRQSAEDRVYMLLPEIKKANPKVLTVVTGCLSGRADVQRRLEGSVDIWLPINELPGLARKLNIIDSSLRFRCVQNDKREGGLIKLNNKFVQIQPTPALSRHPSVGGELGAKGSVGGYLKINPKYGSTFSAFVPIGNGCDNFCAYCVVPYARGREVYRPAKEIVDEVKGLVKKGCKEIFLIAQNVNSYVSPCIVQNTKGSSRRRSAPPQDDKSAVNFAGLLKMVNAIPGDFWVRFATSHPKDMSEELIETIAGCEKVCRQIHLPVQAGDNETLRRMNRKYTREHYLGLLKKIRKAMPDAMVSTDVIVGFPGETKAQFQNTAKLFREAKYDQAFISQYSPRPGTAASKLKDNVTKLEKKNREEVLMGILRKTALANNRACIGKEVEVLVEGSKGDYFFGKTKDGKNIRIAGEKKSGLAVGNFIKAAVVSVKEFNMFGRFLE